MQKKFIKFIFLIYTLFYVGGNSYANTVYQKKETNINKINKILNKDYLYKQSKEEYILDQGDTLAIMLSEEIEEKIEPKLIKGDGTIFLPKLKNVYVAGLTIKELKNILNEAYREFILEPSVEIEIISYRPIIVYVEGEVNNPGRKILEGAFRLESKASQFDNPFQLPKQNESLISTYQNTSDSEDLSSLYFPTVFDAIRSAGGITQFSNLKEISLIRKDSISNGEGFKKTKLDLETDLIRGEESQNIRIFDGDKILVKKTLKKNQNLVSRAVQYDLNQKFINVNVFGRVNSPGKLVLARNSSLNDAIAVAGGAKALRGKIKLISFKNTGSIENRRINYNKGNKRGTFNNPFLNEGDLVIIDDSFLSTSSEVIKEITSPFQGLFSTYGLIKAFSD